MVSEPPKAEIAFGQGMGSIQLYSDSESTDPKLNSDQRSFVVEAAGARNGDVGIFVGCGFAHAP